MRNRYHGLMFVSFLMAVMFLSVGFAIAEQTKKEDPGKNRKPSSQQKNTHYSDDFLKSSDFKFTTQFSPGQAMPDDVRRLLLPS